ncbi:MAG TPA: alpha-hydroxy acid oxidase [Xanthobacteraceae bacterium]|nr:alpha-hydroxy acid oxidase [Xanthobacteraceae bacterium]
MAQETMTQNPAIEEIVSKNAGVPATTKPQADPEAEKFRKLRRSYPTIDMLRRRARWRVPRFAFDFVDGSANDEICVARNSDSLAGIEVLPHYCVDTKGISTEVELFGKRYAAPFGISPMGSGGLMWPGAEKTLAREAQRRKIPYVLATPASASIEEIAKIAPDVFWFQLYRFSENNHAITYDLVRRAEEAGANVLVPTIDSAGKSKRPRDIRNDVRVPFRIGPRIFFQVASSPLWALQLWRNGMLRTENLVPYVKGPATRDSTGKLMRINSTGSHTFDELARLRDRWKKPFVVKGVLHPADAERLVSLGVDGLIVSNHGGRHFDGAPASIDILPAIVSAVGSKATVMIDSGIRGGLDMVRALALGAKFTFAGRPYLYSLGALGSDGARHMIEMFADELKTEFQHVGVRTVDEAAKVTVRHKSAWRFDLN